MISKLVSFTESIVSVCHKRRYSYKCVHLIIPFEVAYDRTFERSGKQLKICKFYNSWRSALTASKTLLKRGVDISFIDVLNVKESKIGDAVLEVINE